MKSLSRRTLTVMAALLFVFSAFLSPKSAAAGDPCQNCTTHAYIVCQSATFKSSYSWSSTTLGTLYQWRKVGSRNLNNYYDGQQDIRGGFELILDYPSGRWGYIIEHCVDGYLWW